MLLLQVVARGDGLVARGLLLDAHEACTELREVRHALAALERVQPLLLHRAACPGRWSAGHEGEQRCARGRLKHQPLVPLVAVVSTEPLLVRVRLGLGSGSGLGLGLHRLRVKRLVP